MKKVLNVCNPSVVRSSDKIRKQLHNAVRHGGVTLCFETVKISAFKFRTSVYAVEVEPVTKDGNTTGGVFQHLLDFSTQTEMFDRTATKLHADSKPRTMSKPDANGNPVIVTVAPPYKINLMPAVAKAA